ncbi:hypothetical protein Vretimale_2566 [Volvox reticuliferus]|nr:hypothetical protein Vretimale_2566 [Volvox reticuliferus]
MPGQCLSGKGFQELAALQPPICPGSYPRTSPGKIVLLTSSGRRLGYDEYVDTSVPAHQLRNVVLLPGIPGTRLFTHPSVQQRGFVPSWRLVVLERPGIGLSDPAPATYTYTDFVADFWEFCALLGLSRVAVIGFSAGTPFATAVACVPPSGTTTTTATTTTTTTTTSSNIATSSLTTRVKNPTSGLPANDVKSSPIVGNPLCSPADDAQPAAPVVTLTSTPAASAAADSIAAVAPAAVLSPVATEATAATASTAAAATTVTSTSTLTVTATPTLAAASISRVTAPAVSAPHPPYNKALASTEVRTETAPDPPAVVALVSAIGPPDVPNKGRGMALVFRVGAGNLGYPGLSQLLATHTQSLSLSLSHIFRSPLPHPAVRLLGMQARAFDNGDDGQSSSFGAETATSGRVAQAICAVQRQG